MPLAEVPRLAYANFDRRPAHTLKHATDRNPALLLLPTSSEAETAHLGESLLPWAAGGSAVPVRDGAGQTSRGRDDHLPPGRVIRPAVSADHQLLHGQDQQSRLRVRVRFGVSLAVRGRISLRIFVALSDAS